MDRAHRSKPNIVLILIDDMGWRDISCYGSNFYETPNIDRLAGEGMRFTDAYAACPVCSPTRASILTGRYPATIGITDWIDWYGTIHPARGRLIDVPYLKNLPASEVTLARTLAENGYATWHVGKWHLGDEESLPEDHGFQVNIGGCRAGSPSRGGYFSPWSIPALQDVDVPEGTYLTDYLTDRAVELVRKKGDTPFFLNMWYYSVHIPIQAKAEKIRKYEAKAQAMGLDKIRTFEEGGFFPSEHKKHLRISRRLVQSDPVYAAMIESLDENIGRLLRAVEESGEAANTIVIFTSDNGGLATSEGSPTCNAPLAEGKGWMYEGGTREPLIVRWPGVVRPGSSCTVPVTSPDFYPTLLDAAGAGGPSGDATQTHRVEGLSFLPLLEGERTAPQRAIFWHYPHYGNQGGTPGTSVRKGDWKLIRFFEDGHEELYNLKRDVGETTNLADAEPGKREELSALLTAWAAEIEAIVPEPNPNYVPWPEREPCGHSAVG